MPWFRQGARKNVFSDELVPSRQHRKRQRPHGTFSFGLRQGLTLSGGRHGDGHGIEIPAIRQQTSLTWLLADPSPGREPAILGNGSEDVRRPSCACRALCLAALRHLGRTRTSKAHPPRLWAGGRPRSEEVPSRASVDAGLAKPSTNRARKLQETSRPGVRRNGWPVPPALREHPSNSCRVAPPAPHPSCWPPSASLSKSPPPVPRKPKHPPTPDLRLVPPPLDRVRTDCILRRPCKSCCQLTTLFPFAGASQV